MLTKMDDVLTLSFGLIRSHRRHQHSCPCQSLGFPLPDLGCMSSQTLTGDIACPLLSSDAWAFTSLQNIKDDMCAPPLMNHNFPEDQKINLIDNISLQVLKNLRAHLITSGQKKAQRRIITVRLHYTRENVETTLDKFTRKVCFQDAYVHQISFYHHGSNPTLNSATGYWHEGEIKLLYKFCLQDHMKQDYWALDQHIPLSICLYLSVPRSLSLLLSLSLSLCFSFSLSFLLSVGLFSVCLSLSLSLSI